IYEYIIGFLQLSGALLLLNSKTRFLGIALLIPILSNIVLIDIFYDLPIATFGNSFSLLIILILLLWLNKEKTIMLLKLMFTDQNSIIKLKKLYIVLGVCITALIVQSFIMLLNLTLG